MEKEAQLLIREAQGKRIVLHQLQLRGKKSTHQKPLLQCRKGMSPRLIGLSGR